MTTKQLISIENEVVMMAEVNLCLICCSKVKTKKDHHLNNNDSQLQSSNLIKFYLLRRMLQVPGIELKKTLISCGNSVEWIKLCDKCTELTGQAEELHRKLRKIERELSCVQQLIWDKARLSINSEDEVTIEQTKKSSHVWRRIRSHTENKCTLKERSFEVEPLINPFTEGDKLAEYLLTQNTSTAILPRQHSKGNANVEVDHINLLEENNVESSSSSPPSPPTIKIEVTPDLDLEQPICPETLVHKVKVEVDDQGGGDKEEDVKLEEMEVDESREDRLLPHEQLDDDDEEEEELDWNWESDNDNDREEEDDDEVDEDATEKNLLNYPLLGSLPEGIFRQEKGMEMSKVKEQGPSQTQKRRQRRMSTEKYRKMERTEDGKYKCRYCHLTFAGATGCNGHEREKHSKTPGAFICSICGRAFNSRDYLRKPTKRSHNPDGSSAMKNRKMIRTQDGKYRCREAGCDKLFAAADSLLAHEHEKHSKNPGGFICDICGKAFNSALYLRGHKFKTHKIKGDGTPRTPNGEERNHICDKCGKGFNGSQKLNQHVKFVHEKSFSIKCVLCGVGKRRQSALKSHMLTMHPEEPSTKQLVEEEGLNLWRCRWRRCSARYLKDSGLKDHLERMHDGKEEQPEAAFKATCETCGKVCRSKAGLTQHEETHRNVGTRDYFCDKCGKGFRMESGVRYHKKRTSCGGGGGGGKLLIS